MRTTPLPVLSLVLLCSLALGCSSTSDGEISESAVAGTPTLFFLDIAFGRVLSMPVDATEPAVLVNAGTVLPDGIAVDVDAGHVYWTNMGIASAEDGFIQRAQLDGSDVRVIVPAGATHTPKQLEIEPQSRKLYWSDREGMKVQRANLDGTENEALVTVAEGDAARSDLKNHCVGVAVDYAGGWFYWTQKGPDNGHVGTIKRAHLETPPGEDHLTRTDIEVLFEGLPEPIDLELDLENGHIYWTDRGDNTVNRANIEMPQGASAATRTDREILVSDVSEAIGIAIDHTRGLLYYTGLAGQLGRARLDGSNHVELLTGMGSLTGVAVVELP